MRFMRTVRAALHGCLLTLAAIVAMSSATAGALQSPQDRAALDAALAKAIASETRFGNPTAGGSGAADDQFGYAVAVSGDTAVIGARSKDIGTNGAQGAVYVFVRNGGAWSPQVLLTAADGSQGDEFGRSVAISGDVLAVGAPFDDNGSAVNQGSVYLYRRTGSTWSFVTKLLAADGSADDDFGWSVAMGTDHVLVGAVHDDGDPNDNRGSAYVFAVNAGIWSQQARLSADDGGFGDGFGSAVSLSGNSALIGAEADDVAAGDQGSAYVFTRSGTVWTQQARLSAADGAGGDFLGSAVSLSGDIALLGAPMHDLGPDTNRGAAYVFTRAGGIWTERLKLTASDGAANDQFGSAVAVLGVHALVGTGSDDEGANADQGAVYWFNGSGASWTQRQKLQAVAGAAGDRFGHAVAIDGTTLVIGAAFDDIGSHADEGSAAVHVHNGTNFAPQATLAALEGTVNDRFGASVAVSGNIAVVGMEGDDLGVNTDQGSVYVFARVGGDWTLQQRLLASDGAGGDGFGHSVAIDGDTIVVGAWRDDDAGNVDEGAAYVYVRNGNAWPEQAKLQAPLGAAGDFLGHAVAISGDTVLLSAHRRTIGAGTNQGDAVVFVRNGSTWSQQTRLVSNDGAAGDSFGYSVSLSGNTALIGAIANDQVALNAGAAYVFVRSGTSWSQTSKLTAGDGAGSDGFGIAVAISGDNALVGAPQDDVGGANNQGSAYFFRRSGAIWTEQLRVSPSDAPNDLFGDNTGAALALQGDLALIASPRAVVGGNGRQGAAWLFSRASGAWVMQNKITASDGAADDGLGNHVALSGGYAVIGAVGDDGAIGAANPDEGAAYVFNIQYAVSVTAHGNGAISPSGNLARAANETITFTLTPAPHHGVSAVSGCGGTWSGGNSFSTRPIVADCAVTASFANTAPTLAPLADVTVLEDGLQDLVIDVTDAESGGTNVTVTTGSSNPAVVPAPHVAGGAVGDQRILRVEPAANAVGGPVTITVTATDPLGLNMQRTFSIDVAPVNDAPSLATTNLPNFAAGSSGVRSIAAFASMDAGPPDEAAQAVAAYQIDAVADPDSVVIPGSVSIDNAGTLSVSLTGVGGTATVTARVRDNGGTANGGVDLSQPHTFDITVAPSADLQVAISNDRSVLVEGETTVYAIVVANAGPNAVSGARLLDNVPNTLDDVAWMCLPAASTADCPVPSAGTGNLDALVSLGAGQFLRFDLMGEVDGVAGASVVNTASVSAPGAVADLVVGNDSASDQDLIVPDAVFADGFESGGDALTVPGAAAALADDGGD